MTKKDYILIAGQIRKARDEILAERGSNFSAYDLGAKEALYLATRAIASDLAKENPRFDLERFVIAALGKEALPYFPIKAPKKEGDND